MAKAVNDNEVTLRKRARRRLIGAVALVLLAIIILPMMLDHEPAPLAPDLAVSAAGDAEKFSSRVVPVPAPDRTPADPARAGSDPAPNPAPPAETPAAKSPAPAPAAGSSTPSEILEPPAVQEQVDPSTSARSKDARSAKPEKPVDAKKSAVGGADAKAKKPAAPAETKIARGETFAVQLESFANAANARQLQDKLAANSVKSYTEVVETRQGKRTRVRVGPFPTREAAEQTRARLKTMGFNGVVRP